MLTTVRSIIYYHIHRLLESMVQMADIISRIAEMRGSMHVFPLNDDCREKILDIESDIKAALGIKVINEGVKECLSREHVVCIIKKASFRPPPEPTVMLLSDDGVVLGEEVLPHYKKEFLANVKEDIIWLSEEFVMYPERKGNRSESFIMPPVSFPEVEEGSTPPMALSSDLFSYEKYQRPHPAARFSGMSGSSHDILYRIDNRDGNAHAQNIKR